MVAADGGRFVSEMSPRDRTTTTLAFSGGPVDSISNWGRYVFLFISVQFIEGNIHQHRPRVL